VRNVIGFLAVCSAGAVLLAQAAPARLLGPRNVSGSRPPLAVFEGRFAGTGSAYSSVAIDTTAGPGIRAMSGHLPTRCVVRGEVKLPDRDGAIGIIFNLWDRGKTTGSRLIKPGGAFSFKFHHRADVAKSTTYTVWIRGTFSGSSVRGRVKGVAKDDFSGSCAGERVFTARAKR
jgi:hypothetical protein